MKKSLAFLMAVLMTLSLCACKTGPLPSQDTNTNAAQTPTKNPDAQIAADDLAGTWYLDRGKNDFDRFCELFPGYGEWGAVMEIRPEGEIFWYIGAIGGSGTYTLDGDRLTASLKQAIQSGNAAPQDWTVDFSVAAADGDVTLTMIYEDVLAVWSHRAAPDADAEEWKTEFEASLLKLSGVTPDRYEHLGDGIYQVYVTIEGNSVPYVTVDSATGEYHR